MKKLFFVIPLICLLCLTFSCQKGEEVAEEPGVKPLSDEDMTAINGTFQGFIQACLDGNWDLAVSYFTEDGLRMPLNAPIEQGREAFRAHFDVVEKITEWTIHSSDIDGECGIAYVRYSYTVTGVLKGMSEPVTYTGKALGILQKQEDGSWLFIMDIWNSDAPM
jgi:ketosteroid isomerase-like protein